MSRTIALTGALDEAQGQRVAAEIQRAAGHIIHLRIDSPGGTFGAAIEVAMAIEEHDKAVVATVTGEACSAAGLVALAGDRRRIAPAGTLMLHYPSQPRGWSSVGERAESYRRMERVIAEYCSAPLSTIKTWLGSERFFTAGEAKAEGLVDTIDAGPLPVFLKEPAKRAPRKWLREWRDFYERAALREHVGVNALNVAPCAP